MTDVGNSMRPWQIVRLLVGAFIDRARFVTSRRVCARCGRVRREHGSTWCARFMGVA